MTSSEAQPLAYVILELPRMPSSEVQSLAYAIYFDEGPGYLFVEKLGKGAFGETTLVRSCAPPFNLCVRKRVLQQHYRNEDHDGNQDLGISDLDVRTPILQQHDGSEDLDIPDEVSNYPEHRLVPALIDWTSYGVASYAVTMQYCNAGTLSNLLQTTTKLNLPPVPELMVWKLFVQLLEVIDYLHYHSNPPTAHSDIAPRNVFVHWPETSLNPSDASVEHIPEFFLGDLGLSESTSETPNDEAFKFDILCLQALMAHVCTCRVKGVDERLWKQNLPPCYSPELRRCISMINEQASIPPVSVLKAEITPIARRKMIEFSNRTPGIDLRFTWQPHSTSVKAAVRKADLDSFGVKEAFSTAIITASANPDMPAIMDLIKNPDVQKQGFSGAGVMPGRLNL